MTRFHTSVKELGNDGGQRQDDGGQRQGGPS
jgi:hypothetical protein